MSDKKENEYVAVGGQALMEGIMMKGPKGTSVALRLPDGTIETQMKNVVSVRKKYKFLNIPFVRGIVAFIESLVQGYAFLMESAEKTTDMTEEETDSKLDKWITEHFGKKMMAFLGTIATVLGAGIAFLLFFYLPTLLYSLLNDYVVKGVNLSEVGAFNFRPVIEGVIRIIIFVAYMLATAQMKEIKRVYMYHGAEHKTIFCFEHGHELTPANVMKEKRFHPRCGTSFIFVTILLSILISSIVAMVIPTSVTEIKWLWILIKLALLPLIMGIGFEFIQLAGKYPNKFTKALSAPGLAMQRITTSEPDEEICEVAIAAMKAALTGEVPEKEIKEEAKEKKPAPGANSQTFMNLPDDIAEEIEGAEITGKTADEGETADADKEGETADTEKSE